MYSEPVRIECLGTGGIPTAFTIYNAGSNTLRTLLPTERVILEILSVQNSASGFARITDGTRLIWGTDAPETTITQYMFEDGFSLVDHGLNWSNPSGAVGEDGSFITVAIPAGQTADTLRYDAPGVQVDPALMLSMITMKGVYSTSGPGLQIRPVLHMNGDEFLLADFAPVSPGAEYDIDFANGSFSNNDRIDLSGALAFGSNGLLTLEVRNSAGVTRTMGIDNIILEVVQDRIPASFPASSVLRNLDYACQRGVVPVFTASDGGSTVTGIGVIVQD